jgi:hypothetical protein
LKRLEQTVSCFLAVCLAFAGAIGLSPSLHTAIEHGGHGTEHTHVLRHTHGGTCHAHALPAVREAGVFIPATEHQSGESDEPHRHSSLAQLLLNGFAAAASPVIEIGTAFLSFCSLEIRPELSPVFTAWTFLGAGRAPPLS